jgi:DNA-binding response OmpR family regulator
MSKRNTILVVEDERALRELLSLRLQAQNYEIFSAEDGQTALILCKEKKPDLMLLDVNLPDILGVDIAEVIQASKTEFGPPKIIVITGIAYSVDDPKERWQREYGVADFVTKPFDYEDLLRKIEFVLKSK